MADPAGREGHSRQFRLRARLLRGGRDHVFRNRFAGSKGIRLKSYDGICDEVGAGRKCRERLGEFRSISIERYRLEHRSPCHGIRSLDIFDGDIVGHIYGLRNRASDEGLYRSHHRNVRLPWDTPRTTLARRRRRVEHGKVCFGKVRRAFEPHCSTRKKFSCFYLFWAVAKPRKQAKLGSIGLFFGYSESFQYIVAYDVGREATL